MPHCRAELLPFLGIDVAGSMKDNESMSFSNLEYCHGANSTELQVSFCGTYIKHGELHSLTSSYFIFINSNLFTASVVNKSKNNLVERPSCLFVCPRT